MRLYPDPAASELVAAIAGTLGMAEDDVFVGDGSDEVLAHAFNGFFRDKGPLLFPDVPTAFTRPIVGSTTCHFARFHSTEISNSIPRTIMARAAAS